MYSKKRGFTLIELLVVIAIIALLLGVLLPALGKARNTAMAVKSKANLRSIGQIQFLYAGDFRDSYINPFNTKKAGGGVGAGGWASATKPGLNFRWEFTGPGKWYSEMYAFHWYSLIGGWLNESDYASEVQFAPADRTIIGRFQDLQQDEPGFTLSTGIWDSSYVLSPTVWFSPKRYAEDDRPNAVRNNGPQAMARRNKVSETSFPSSKAIVWERFDWSQNSRRATIPNPLDPSVRIEMTGEETHPQWNNSQAVPSVLTADGSVIQVPITDIEEKISSSNDRVAESYRPTDQFNPPTSLFANYGMDQDQFEIGSNLVGFGPGLYPAYFWATRDGIKGLDFPR